MHAHIHSQTDTLIRTHKQTHSHTHTHTHKCTHTHIITYTQAPQGSGSEEKSWEKRKIFKEDSKELTVEAGHWCQVVGVWYKKM